MKETFSMKQRGNCYHTQQVKKEDIVGAVCEHLEELTAQDQLKHMGCEVFNKHKCVFEPHVDELPTNVYCQIQLKDASKSIMTWSYSSPRSLVDLALTS